MRWFWTNALMGKIESVLVIITNKLWKKRREYDKKNTKK